MILSEEVKNAIRDEFESFKTKMYKGLTKEERKKYGMVYTPAEVSIKMIEKFNCEEFGDQTILDPCCGSGNLLVACLLAGARADKILGNELNSKMVKLARRRIQDICDDTVKYPNIRCREKFVGLHHHIHVGDATNPYCLNHFGDRYNYNMTEANPKADAAEEDNLPPTSSESLYQEGIGGKLGYTKQSATYILKNLISDQDYPVADKDSVLTAEDYKEIISVTEIDEDEAMNSMLKTHEDSITKSAKTVKAKKAVVNNTTSSWDIFKNIV